MGFYESICAGVILKEGSDELLEQIKKIEDARIIKLYPLSEQNKLQKDKYIWLVYVTYRSEIQRIHNSLSDLQIKDIEWRNIKIHTTTIVWPPENCFEIYGIGKYYDR